MTHDKPFTERFNEMLGVALMRHGILRRGHSSLVSDYDSFYRADPELYREVGLRFTPGKQPPKITKARCTRCRAALTVVDVRDEESSRFGSTMAGNETFTHAVGRLVCSRDEAHMRPEGSRYYQELMVVVESTMGEMIGQLDSIASELGY